VVRGSARHRRCVVRLLATEPGPSQLTTNARSRDPGGHVEIHTVLGVDGLGRSPGDGRRSASD
jgi:hypothetical protein